MYHYDGAWSSPPKPLSLVALVFKFLGKSKKHFSFSQQFHILGLNNWRELRQEANEGGKKETLLMERPRHHREKKILHVLPFKISVSTVSINDIND